MNTLNLTYTKDDYTIGLSVQDVKAINPFYNSVEAITILKDLAQDDRVLLPLRESLIELINNVSNPPHLLYDAIKYILTITYGSDLGVLFYNLIGDTLVQTLIPKDILFKLYSFYHSHNQSLEVELLEYFNNLVHNLLYLLHNNPNNLIKYIATTDNIEITDKLLAQLNIYWYREGYNYTEIHSYFDLLKQEFDNHEISMQEELDYIC